MKSQNTSREPEKSDFDRTVLDSGVRVLSSTLPHTQAVSILLLFGAGSRYETNELAGASHLFEHLLFKGTEKRTTPRDISEVVEGVGGILNAYTDREITGYWCRLALPHYRQGLDVLVDMIRNSLLRQTDIAREKQVVFEEIRASHDSPGGRVAEMADDLLWPDQAMGRDIAGSIDSVDGISREAMKDYLDSQYVAPNCVLAIAGAVTHDELVEQAAPILGDLGRGNPAPMFPFVDNLRGPVVRIEYRKTEQVQISLGIHGISMFDGDRHALHLMSVALGESMGSRLFQEVREKRGLAYAINSSVSNYSDCGAIHVESGVDPKRVEEAIQVIVHEIARLRDGLADDELARAKDLSKGRLMLRMEESRAVASSLGIQELLKGDVKTVDEIISDIDDVGNSDVIRVANRLLVANKLVLGAVGPLRSEDRLIKHLNL